MAKIRAGKLPSNTLITPPENVAQRQDVHVSPLADNFAAGMPQQIEALKSKLNELIRIVNAMNTLQE